MDHLHLCTSMHLLTLLFYYYCCCTVCTALLFSYSAIFIAASVRNKLIHSSICRQSPVQVLTTWSPPDRESNLLPLPNHCATTDVVASAAADDDADAVCMYVYVYVCMRVVPVEQIYAAKPFRSAPAKGMSWAARPLIISEVYQAAEPPPALQKLNCFRSVQATLIRVSTT